MAQLDDYKQNITANLIALEDLIHRSPLYHNDQTKWKSQIDKLVSQIRKQNLLLEDGTKDIPESQRRQYVGSVSSFKTKLAKLQRDVEHRQRGESYMGYQKTNIIKTAEEKNKSARQQMLFQQGDEAQDATMNSVRTMIGITERGQQLANEINLELTAQIEQLDRMNQKTEDTRSTLKKAQKNITYFVKALECDKCMVGLLALILLALVAVIVLAVKKNQN